MKNIESACFGISAESKKVQELAHNEDVGETMEFYEKLQELRKSRGLTQEELAEMLYVSRTAISKWESGRGYPNMDSLKAISKCFSVSLDDLLSSETILTIAEEDGKQKEGRMQSLVFGLLDCGFALLLFLPLFGQREAGIVRAVSLLTMTSTAHYIKAVFFTLIAMTILSGILLLALQNCHTARWLNVKDKFSIGLSTVNTLIFIATMQPYAAVFAFVFLAIKALLLIKRA